MNILVTGSAGFIGFHTSKYLLDNSDNTVIGLDGLTDYYDVNLKNDRNEILNANKNYVFKKGLLEDADFVSEVFDEYCPDIVIHLAAQAGVRYSLENPKAYIDSNIFGSFNILENSKKAKTKHLLIASTSSVYGDNKEMPFKEEDKADSQLTVYSASKKACESLAHSYSHLYQLPITMFRFFTVYGPYGRPDLALFKFTDAILNDRPIDIYNNGDMFRDFTYVDDLVKSIDLLKDNIPKINSNKEFNAAYRIVNIGNSNKVNLMDFIKEIEECLEKKAIYNFMPMQPGDVPATWADSEYLESLIGYKPSTKTKDGIKEFVSWFRSYYNK